MDDAVGAGCGQVMGAAGCRAGEPERCAVGAGDDLHVHAVLAVLHRVVRLVGGDAVGFASTNEGATSNPQLGRTFSWCQINSLTRRTGPGWSACVIPGDENTAVGRDDLRIFYNENRVLKDDKLHVWIVR
ncbi:hypothetical protein [Streptomyces sp. I4(2020)]|uniref:hypothetical protein n=1 Tax=Streptomyces TaxID=1883 RepID=UPI0035A8A03A